MHVEITSRLTTNPGEPRAVVWDARVVDDHCRVYWVCDHGHRSGWSAQACGSRNMLALRARGCPAVPFTSLRV